MEHQFETWKMMKFEEGDGRGWLKICGTVRRGGLILPSLPCVVCRVDGGELGWCQRMGSRLMLSGRCRLQEWRWWPPYLTSSLTHTHRPPACLGLPPLPPSHPAAPRFLFCSCSKKDPLTTRDRLHAGVHSSIPDSVKKIVTAVKLHGLGMTKNGTSWKCDVYLSEKSVPLVLSSSLPHALYGLICTFQHRWSWRTGRILRLSHTRSLYCYSYWLIQNHYFK